MSTRVAERIGSETRKPITLPKISSKYPVEFVTCDVDGTLLNSHHDVDPRVEKAILRTLKSGVNFVCASGKARQGVLNSVGPVIAEAMREAYGGGVPGVFLNGLTVYGPGGKLVYEKKMPEAVCWKIVNKARELGITLVAYNGDTMMCEKHDEETDKLKPYKEPAPEAIGKWEEVIGKMSIHKFMYLAPVDVCKKYRPEIDVLLEGEAKVTQAIPDMIEVLPFGGNKGEGVRQFLKAFGASKDNLLALGDAENDLEMFKLAKYAVAMGNALPCLKEVATHVVSSNDNAGVSQALEAVITFRQSLTKEENADYDDLAVVPVGDRNLRIQSSRKRNITTAYSTTNVPA